MAGTTLTLRPMTPEDLDTVIGLEELIYPEPWSPGMFKEELAQQNRRYLVAVDEAGDIVGYGGMMLIDEDAHITTVAVAPAARGRRLGTRLMLALAETALQVGAAHLTLEVRLSNESAQRLYRRFGFAPVGLRKNYYRNEDALVMWAIDIDTAEYRRRIGRIKEDLG